MLSKLISGASFLAIGTLTGQGLVLLSTPFLARIYNASDFGLLAIATTICNIATIAACLRYDLAITTANKKNIHTLTILSIFCAMAVAIICLLFYYIYISIFGNIKISHILVFLAVLLPGLLQLQMSILLRVDRFRVIGLARVALGASFLVAAFFESIGLVAAYILSYGITSVMFFKGIKIKKIKIKKIINKAKEFQNFPKVVLPGALLDIVAFSFCVWIIASAYGVSETGKYSQIQRLIGAPILIISMSFGQLVLRYCSENSSKKYINVFYNKALLAFIGLGLLFLLLLYFFGQPVLEILLTKEWRTDAEFFMPIALAIAARACASPLSSLLIVTKNFKVALYWQIGYLASSLIILSYASMKYSFIGFLNVYALHEIVQYTVYLIYIKRSIK